MENVINAKDEDFEYQDMDTDENPGGDSYVNHTVPTETLKSQYPIVNNEIL